MKAFVGALLLMMTLSFVSCGEDSNVNALLTTDAKSGSFGDTIAEADRQYNLGNYDSALILAQSAYGKNSQSEEVAVLLGKIYLALAGVDTFSLASSLIDQSVIAEAATKTGTTTSSDDCGTATGAVKALCQLASVIGLKPSDYDAMTTESGSDSYRFPKTSEEARDSGVTVVEAINTAITFLCPFVNDEAKILVTSGSDRTADDYRHATTACPKYTGPKYLSAKIHYLWSFAHLVEGIAFYAVFSAQLEPLTVEISSIDTSNPLTFIKNVSTISTAVDKILPTDAVSSSKTMLTGIFNDLETAGAAFGQIPGMPAEITKAITDAITELKAQTSAIGAQTSTGSGSAGIDSSAAALKSQFTTEITTELQGKIANPDGSLTQLGTQITSDAEQKATFCESYNQITASSLAGVCD